MSAAARFWKGGVMSFNAASVKRYVLEAITIVLMFAGFFIHAAPLPDFGWKVLFIFIGLMFGWSTVGLGIPSLIGILALGLTGAFTVDTAWQAGFGGNVVALVVLISVLSKWLEKVGLIDTVMGKFMASKRFVGKPWLFITAFLVLIYFLGFLIGSVPSILIGWACAYQIIRISEMDKHSPLSAFLIVNIAAIGAFGDYCKPWSVWGLVTIQNYDAMFVPGGLSYPAFIAWSTAVYAVAIALVILAARFIFRIDVSKLAKCTDCDFSIGDGKTRFTAEQKFAVGVMVLMIVLLFAPTFLPNCALKTFLKTIGTTGTIILVVVIAALFRKKDGEDYFNFAKMADYAGAVPWNVILLLTVTVPLGAALKDTNAGIIQIVAAFAHTSLNGLSPILFLIAVSVFLFLLTQVAHNLVCLVAIVPIFMVIAQNLGANPVLVLMLGQLLLTAALGTPAASTRAGMLYGNTEWVTMGSCYKWGWINGIAALIAALAVGIPLGILMF